MNEETLLKKKLFLLVRFDDKDIDAINEVFENDIKIYNIQSSNLLEKPLSYVIENTPEYDNLQLPQEYIPNLKICILCGIEDEKVFKAIRIIKSIFPENIQQNIIFARAVKNNLKMTLKELSEHLVQDYEYTKEK